MGQPLYRFLAEEICTSWMQRFVFDENTEPLQNQETILHTADKEEVPVLASASLIRDEAGDLHGAVFLLRDLRDRKKLEEQIVRSKRMESIGLMAGGVAHDLNNILAGIIGYPELLLKTLPKDSNLREPLEAIWESG
ncbi:MAG: hypothetical protein D3908_11600, partial [Candidatus Electrothrix sp. AUS4]|nr:hypothetical protein [Candidatus Electrothrix sp. AUS4]